MCVYLHMYIIEFLFSTSVCIALVHFSMALIRIVLYVYYKYICVYMYVLLFTLIHALHSFSMNKYINKCVYIYIYIYIYIYREDI